MAPFKAHIHNWQKTTRTRSGVVFYLHICVEHEKPLIKTYDMEVINKNEFMGESEFVAKGNKK